MNVTMKEPAPAGLRLRVGGNTIVRRAPLVSIAMCTYNGARFLRAQLDSLLAQDYPNLEIIIVDDHSTDQTADIIREYVAKNNRIRFYQNETNLGFVANFEKCMRLCTGEYIALCDQDDIWFPHKISTQLQEIGEASLIYSRIAPIDSHDQPLDVDMLPVNRLSGRCCLGLFFENCVTGHLALFKADLLKQALPIPPRILHDHWLAFIAAAKGGLHAQEAPMSLYRIHGDNESIKNKTKARENIFRKMARHRAAVKFNLSKRRTLIEAALESGLLLREERQVALALLAETKRLGCCFVNGRLKHLLRQQAALLLPVFKNPAKARKKLSRGYFYYQTKLFL
jgi:glycosyltransferase involved in cell wall biosynthesis